MRSHIDEKIKESREVIEKAMIDHQPYATVALFSGGGDSLGMAALLKILGVRVDYIMHGITGTGLPDTLEYVRKIKDHLPGEYIEASAGDAYERYVLRKGFFGRGMTAHAYAYHVLKSDAFEKAMSKYIVQRKRGRKILLFNGVREDESDNRSKNYDGQLINIYPRKPNNIWVNVVYWWSKKELAELVEELSLERNPVSLALNRSGECYCGTSQNQADRLLASQFNPEWGKWLDDLERRVIANGFPWRWGQEISKSVIMERDGQINMFMPMCVGCKSNSKGKSL